MPFTPFHFGPGALIKSVLDRYFSFLTFVAAQVITDFETLYYMVTDQYPLHRLLHTYLGCNITLLIMAILAKLLYPIIMKKSLPWRSAFLGAGLGAYSHVFLDSVMHSDMRPFAPFSQANPVFRVIGLRPLHLFCLFAGIAGAVIWMARQKRLRRAE